MSITIGAYTYDNLTAQPIAYEGDAKDGLTSRRFDAKVFIEDADFASLIGQYDTWRDARINDPDTLLSQTLGTTINVSGTWDGVTVTNLPCWYFTPPQQINKLGGYYAVEVSMIDAAQYLEVLLKTKEKQQENQQAELPNLGTITLGTTVVTLLQRAEGYEQLPQAELSMAGNLHVTGPRAAVRVRNVRGYTDGPGIAAIESWLETQVSANLGPGDFLPVSWGQPDAEVVIQNGVKSTRYTIDTKVVVF